MENFDSHPASQRNRNLSMPTLCHRQAQAVAVVRAREQLQKNRPQSFVFMINPNPVEEAVLSKWGITVLSEQADSPQEALLKFLTKLVIAHLPQ